jgi:hypothetical protein
MIDNYLTVSEKARNIALIPLTLYVARGNLTSCCGCPPLYGDLGWQRVYVIKVTRGGFTVLE